MKKLLPISMALVLALSLSLCACTQEKEEVVPNQKDEIEHEVRINEVELNILENMLTDVKDHMEVGTAGSSLKAVPYAHSFLSWSLGTEIKDIEIKMAYENVLEKAEVKDEFKMQIELLESTCKELLSDNAKDLIEDSGLASEELPWKDIKDYNDSLKYLFSLAK